MKHWVFDLDGTLVDSFSHYFIALDTIFRTYEKSFDMGLRYPALTDSIPDFFAKHLGPLNVSSALGELQSHANRDSETIRIFDGLSATLSRLAQQGSRVAVWTNRDLESAQLILEQTGLARVTDICISGTCVSKRKPDPEGLLRIIELFNCDTNEVTMVGDHEHDVIAAKSVGARAVRASWHSYWEVDQCRTADFQFYSVQDFTKWIDGATARQL